MNEFRLDTFLISILIFSFIIAAGSGWISDMATHYGVTYDSRFGATYDTVNEFENLTRIQKENVIGGEVDETDPLDASIKGATSAIKLMTSPIKTVTLMAEGFEEVAAPALPISKYIKVGLTIMVTFALIYLAFRIRSW